MDIKDLKIVSEKELKKVREHFGLLLREIEYLNEKHETKRTDLHNAFLKAKIVRDLLNGI